MARLDCGLKTRLMKEVKETVIEGASGAAGIKARLGALQGSKDAKS